MTGIEERIDEEVVADTFVRPCLSCGATVRIVGGQEQRHGCRPPNIAEAIARAWWAGFDQAVAGSADLRTELERVTGDWEVAIREAARAREALKAARPILAEATWYSDGHPVRALRLVDAALDKRLAPEETK